MTEDSKNNRRVLGRGLGALLPDADLKIKERYVANKDYFVCDIDHIIPNTRQPRKEFEESEILSLSESIKENGLIQPILVRKKADSYEIIAGERRWRASKLLGLKEIPVIFKEMSDKATFQTALVENIQRENLNPIEEALAYKSLIEEFDMTQDDISKKVSKDRSTVSNYLRILRLPEEIKEDIRKNIISMGHAKLICSIDDDKTKIEVYRKVKKDNLSVRALEKYLSKKTKFQNKKNNINTDFSSIEDNLREKYQTKVCIKGKYTKGKIVIEFFNRNDLDRIISMLV